MQRGGRNTAYCTITLKDLKLNTETGHKGETLLGEMAKHSQEKDKNDEKNQYHCISNSILK